MEQINKIDWQKMDNLIPVITQKTTTKEVSPFISLKK